MAVSMKDIAKEAGASLSTVSRALNNKWKGKKGKVLRERILRIAARHNYKVHAIAQALRKGGVDSIGFVCPADVYMMSQYTQEVLKGVVEAVCGMDYDLSLNIIPKNKDYIAHYREYCSRSMVRGVLLQDWILWKAKNLDVFFETKLPFVLINSKSDDPRVSYVDSDGFSGAYKATEYLIKLGHKRILHIHGHPNSVNATERLNGYRKALVDGGIPYDESLVVVHDSLSYASAFPILSKLFSEKFDFSAVFATNDEMAVAAIRALEEKGFSIPKDIAVVGFDDLPYALANKPRLTTVRQNVSEIGRTATELLLELAKSKKGRAAQKIVLPTELIIRDSA